MSGKMRQLLEVFLKEIKSKRGSLCEATGTSNADIWAREEEGNERRSVLSCPMHTWLVRETSMDRPTLLLCVREKTCTNSSLVG